MRGSSPIRTGPRVVACAFAVACGVLAVATRDTSPQSTPPSWPTKIIEEKRLSDRRVLRYEHAAIPAWGYTAPRNFVFSVILPETPSRLAPLIVNLHSAGGGNEKELPESAYVTRRAGTAFYGLSLHCYEFDWWWGKQELEKNPAFERDQTPVERRLLETVRWVMRQYPIDPDRVYLIGRSMGGSGAFTIGMPHGDLFAAMHVTVPADETMLYHRLNLPVVRRAGETWSLDKTAPEYLRRVSAADYPDPPFLIDYFSHVDKYAKHSGLLLDVMNEGRFGGVVAWGPFGHTGDVHTVALAALEFPWLSIRRNEAYPVFTRASTNSTYPGFEGAGPDQVGQINAYFRWKNREDTAARFAMELRLVDPFELSLMTRGPREIITDVTPRRLQRFRIEPRQTYRYAFTRGDTALSRGTIVADEAGLITIPRLAIIGEPATLAIER